MASRWIGRAVIVCGAVTFCLLKRWNGGERKAISGNLRRRSEMTKARHYCRASVSERMQSPISWLIIPIFTMKEEW